MKLREIKYTITEIDGDYWIVKTLYILGFSFTYELLGDRASWYSWKEIPFHRFSAAKKELKKLTKKK